MEIYIRSTQSISPQNTFPGKSVPEHLKLYHSHLKNILPDFKHYFPPLELRRMNTLIKSGLACAIETIKSTGIEKPDAIITASGLGCVADTEKFLHSILDSDEGLLTPTAFIQSTNNIIGALIALNFKCHGYNVLYAQKTASFEHALLDTFLYLKKHESATVLTGGFDEITEENLNLKRKVGIYKAENCTNDHLQKSKTQGSMAGEGTSFFLFSNQKNEADFAKIVSVNIYSRFKSSDEFYSWLINCVRKAGKRVEDIDVLVTGNNGDYENDLFYYQLSENKFFEATHAYYKHLCGEFDTASSFGTWVTANAIKNNHFPLHCILRNKNRSIKNVLLVNQSRLSDNICILLSCIK